MLYPFQSGFRSSYSTDTCLLHLVDHIKLQTSKGLFTGMVTIDLQKAFDIVDHQIVCQTLRCMGVKDVKWFESYLTERKQHVNVNVNLNSYMYLYDVYQFLIRLQTLAICR